VLAARAEMAQTLADAVFRRTELGTLGFPGEAALDAAARLMGECMGWEQSRRDAEVAYVRSRLQLAATGRALLAESAASPALVA
jgi:glycerol-3-phosphate dehydrogenase